MGWKPPPSLELSYLKSQVKAHSPSQKKKKGKALFALKMEEALPSEFLGSGGPAQSLSVASQVSPRAPGENPFWFPFSFYEQLGL